MRKKGRWKIILKNSLKIVEHSDISVKSFNYLIQIRIIALHNHRNIFLYPFNIIIS